jgi:tetratricopeptide (TPR) repeat protein
VEKSAEKAVEWFTRAAEKGDATAMSNLGVRYDDGDGVEKNSEKAVEWYTRAADLGHATAMYNMGVCYEHGTGVEKSAEKAVEWYTRAAEKGDGQAMRDLGECYENSYGVEESAKKAVEWYARAAELGHATERISEIIAATTYIGAIRKRATEICIGLQSLELPAFVTLTIIDEAVHENSIRMWAKWELITAVKHYRDRRDV